VVREAKVRAARIILIVKYCRARILPGGTAFSAPAFTNDPNLSYAADRRFHAKGSRRRAGQKTMARGSPTLRRAIVFVEESISSGLGGRDETSQLVVTL
jgi:hypothetical protein